MAGGQGTRLGCDGPKGKYYLNVNPEPKSLYEITVDSLKRANSIYNVVIPWYIMTSKENHHDTVTFFEENQYFGYPKESIRFFMQGELPLINKEGKLLIGKDSKIKEAADGNAGVYASMLNNGIIKDMKQKGVEWLFIGAIDNVLLKMIDPILLGVTVCNNHLIGAKSLVKANPEERVGVFCKNNGRVKVIEYTELPKEMAYLRDENGELAYGESHVMCNLFSMKALDIICNQNLPYHTACKKSEYIDQEGRLVVPDEPNAYKFEKFIFDAFELFSDISILRVKREEEFAPVKNKEGVDSPQTAIKLYNDYWEKNK